MLLACAGKMVACPAGCYCDAPDMKVSCTGADITEIPKNIPADTRFLDIGSTSITTIRKGDFHNLHNLRGVLYTVVPLPRYSGPLQSDSSSLMTSPRFPDMT
ncbi:PREDICTED: leucine-rich repeat-containing protein 3B-like isoform X2 [Branchiostoma belcheri]|uniref:Leucine-rich repeat-containing protein 3B-like isoform X2 n=1 Tax=Branchiostoma belcheri TaxID=7741 RepID=A0A6P4ZZX6_BRABE|nr:PREDICTED: leucine-rich repeat-containing protein 3B-like isoform X2 [Branchiostoma belcheri]